MPDLVSGFGGSGIQWVKTGDSLLPILVVQVLILSRLPMQE